MSKQRANPNNSPWSKLTIKQKRDLLKKYERGNDVFVKGMNPDTLKRRLREFREYDGTTLTDEEIKHKSRTKVDYEGNVASATLVTESYLTQEDIIDILEVDTSIWKVKDFSVKTWDGYRKDVDKDLLFDEGRITGHVRDIGKLNTRKLWSISITFVRIEPIELFPVVKPIQVGNTYKIVSKPARLSDSLTLLIPDTHFGFFRNSRGRLEPIHDRRALHIVLQILNAYQFSNVIHLGDIVDLADWSDKFIRSPEFTSLTQPAIIESGWFMQSISQLQPKASKRAIEGNHDLRMVNYMQKHLQQGYGLKAFSDLAMPHAAMSIPKLLSLTEMGWDWIGGYPDNFYWLTPEQLIEHGHVVSSNPGATAYKMLEKMKTNVYFGHIHREETATQTYASRDGAKVIQAHCPGFLGRLDTVIPGHRSTQDWSQGFTILYHVGERDVVKFQVPINNGVAIFDNKRWVGDESYYLTPLRQYLKGTDYEDWF